MKNINTISAYVDFLFQQDPTKVFFFDEAGFKHMTSNRKYGHSGI